MSTLRKSVARKFAPETHYEEYSKKKLNKKDLIPKWRHSLLQKARKRAANEELVRPVKDLQSLITYDPTVNKLANQMLRQISIIQKYDSIFNGFPDISNLDDFLMGINEIIQNPPPFEGEVYVGVPMIAFLSDIICTQAGIEFFHLQSVSDVFQNILQFWNAYLNDECSDSNSGFLINGSEWMKEEAKEKWKPDLWAKDQEIMPYYKTWNSFFTRHFNDRDKDRPISGINNPSIITSANDGILFRWRTEIKTDDVFWLKDMPYSLVDIFSSPLNDEQQKLFNAYDLVERFKGGSIFQTFLNTYNFHRWWSPVSGRVLFDPQVVQGSYYTNLSSNDFDSATNTVSSYLLHMNCRGICVIDTGDENIGYVCCIPLGMDEISGVEFNDTIYKDQVVQKGDDVGTFQYNGSSFAIIFEDVGKYNKSMRFMSDRKVIGESFDFPMDPEIVLRGLGITVEVGMQIASIVSMDTAYPKANVVFKSKL